MANTPDRIREVAKDAEAERLRAKALADERSALGDFNFLLDGEIEEGGTVQRGYAPIVIPDNLLPTLKKLALSAIKSDKVKYITAPNQDMANQVANYLNAIRQYLTDEEANGLTITARPNYRIIGTKSWSGVPRDETKLPELSKLEWAVRFISSKPRGRRPNETKTTEAK